jgi:branched-chain amino acid aminotransferase
MFDNTHFPRAKKFWFMGKLCSWSQPTVHSMSHALHYGTSAFEGIRAYHTEKGPAIFRLKEHVDRLLNSASSIKMETPFDNDEIINAIKLTIKENSLTSAYIRPLLYYSYGNLGLVPKACPAELVIAAWEWGAYLADTAERGAHVCIVPWRRVHHCQIEMTSKLGGVYVQSAICGMEVRSQGFDEAILLNLEGNIAEGPGENIFIVKNGVLHTNNKSESILEGITRATLLEIANDLGMDSSVGPITKEDFFHADEALFSGTAVEVTPITRVTDASNPKAPKKEYIISTGKVGDITLKLAQTYRDIVHGKRKRYEKWLTYVND